MITINKRRLQYGYLHSAVAQSPFGHLTQKGVPFGVSRLMPRAKAGGTILNPVTRIQKQILRQP